MKTRTKINLTVAAAFWTLGVLALLAGCWGAALVLNANAVLWLCW